MSRPLRIHLADGKTVEVPAWDADRVVADLERGAAVLRVDHTHRGVTTELLIPVAGIYIERAKQQ